tara:strand:- start:188 stop:682 length:495 start_codon:yes stop_codon:yes gene_type:complete
MLKINKFIATMTALSVLLSPLAALSDPTFGDLTLPPASFTYIGEDDLDKLRIIGLDPGPAFCYDVDANAIIITAPARERAKCELQTRYELERQRARHTLEIGRLETKVISLVEKHKEINFIKDQEIERLTQAALKRPNDYSIWWAAGGLVVGVLSTLLIASVSK